MKKITLLQCLISLSNLLFSQQQIPGADFEIWTQNHYNSSYPNVYYWEVEPKSKWASSNPATTIVNSFCMQQTTDAYSGSFAAYLETKSIFGQVASGNLFTGYFISDYLNSKAMRGIPFESKPSFFKGYYKYTSVNYSYNGNSIPDSCSIYAILSKWDGNQRIEIGRAEMYTSVTTTTYQTFHLPFTYFSTETPDTISIVFASSANGEFYRGGVGSKLYIDEVSFEYPSNIQNNNYNFRQFNNTNEWTLIFPELFFGNLSVYDLSGRKLYCKKIESNSISINISEWKTGIYCFNLSSNNVNYQGKICKE